MKVAFAFIFLLSLISLVRGSVYGVVTDFANNDTTTTMYVVEIDTQTGNFTYLAETFKYLEGSVAYNGISSFDQKRGNLYYSVDFESGFIFSVNVHTSTLRPPVSINANWIQNLVYDYTNDNMYVLASFEDETNSEQQYVYLISLSLNNGPDSVVCPNNLFPVFLAYNYKTETIIGVGEGAKPSLHYAFLEFTVTGDTVKCTATKMPLEAGGIATSFSLDPIEQILYIGYAPSGPTSLDMYNINTKSVSSVNVPWVLSDVQVSYTPPTTN